MNTPEQNQKIIDDAEKLRIVVKDQLLQLSTAERLAMEMKLVSLSVEAVGAICLKEPLHDLTTGILYELQEAIQRAATAPGYDVAKQDNLLKLRATHGLVAMIARASIQQSQYNLAQMLKDKERPEVKEVLQLEKIPAPAPSPVDPASTGETTVQGGMGTDIH